MGIKPQQQYNSDVRAFAITTTCFSPRCYEFLRQTFHNNLPHPATIRKWLFYSSTNGEPGICKGSLDMLSKLASDLKTKGEKLVVALVFDEMAIKKHVTWSAVRKKFVGFINFGKYEESDDHLPVASQAIVFMVNGINLPFNCPIGFYFINSLNTAEKMMLIITFLKALTDINVNVSLINSDGLSTNITVFESLGACFDIKNMKPFILNPVNDTKIFVTFDAPHMLKLMRNYLGEEKIMYDDNGESIEWKFYEQLEKYSDENELITHKLTQKHTKHWAENKMKVSLAAQLFSRSVASSMNFLKEKNCPVFLNADATINFTLRINNIFDILNSKKCADGEFKRPLCPENKEKMFEYMNESIEYIKQIRLSSELLIESKKKTGAKGLIIDMVSVMMFYNVYIETGILKEMSTYKFNQDPLESYFGRCRSFPNIGSNNNPTAVQFCSASRKLSVKNSLTCSTFANCKDELNILYVSSSSNRDAIRATQKQLPFEQNVETEEDRAEQVEEELEKQDFIDIYFIDHIDSLDTLKSNFAQDTTIAYIAGTIEDKIKETELFENCNCEKIFEENDKMQPDTIPGKNSVPCVSTFYLCKTAHHLLHDATKEIEFDYYDAVHSIKRKIDYEKVYNKSTISSDQKNIFVDFIIENYIRIQATYIAKKINIKQQSQSISSRCRKINHFNGR